MVHTISRPIYVTRSDDKFAKLRTKYYAHSRVADETRRDVK
jgi:hypothetical protein